MPDLELLTLDLRAPLAYPGLENPPIPGIPLSGRAFAGAASGVLAEARLGEDLEEGMEEIFLLDGEELVLFDPDEGPRLRSPLPAPRYYGRRESGAASPEAGAYTLAPGEYAFVQWTPRDAEELERGLEWFARETWWERMAVCGPYVLRRVREHSRLATQALRRLAG